MSRSFTSLTLTVSPLRIIFILSPPSEAKGAATTPRHLPCCGRKYPPAELTSHPCGDDVVDVRRITGRDQGPARWSPFDIGSTYCARRANRQSVPIAPQTYLDQSNSERPPPT